MLWNGTLNGAFLVNERQIHGETRYSPTDSFLKQFLFGVLRYFWGLILWMLSICGARHPGPCNPPGPFGCSIEFLKEGGWLSGGDLALESQAHFSAVAEHRLVPARACNVTSSSVWAPSCQDVTPGGHAGVGVISFYFFHQRVLSSAARDEGGFTTRQWRHRPSLRHSWLSGRRKRLGEADAY